MLGTFGKVNALWGARSTAALGQAVDELLPLAAERAGGLAWEYYFDYRAGKAPWVSGLAQGTALQALSRAAQRLRRQGRRVPVHRAARLAIFERAAAGGRARARPARASTTRSTPSSPGLRILNGFIQSLDRALRLRPHRRRRPRHARCSPTGEARAREEVPTYDTGAWSLYSRGTVTHESDLGYHTLLRDFLESLCSAHEDRRSTATPSSTSRPT